MAAKPAISPPISPVTNMSKIVLPPKGRIVAILFERMPLFFISIHQARPAHNKKHRRGLTKKPSLLFDVQEQLPVAK